MTERTRGQEAHDSRLPRSVRLKAPALRRFQFFHFRLQLAAALRGEARVFGAAIILAFAPFGLDPAAKFDAIERGIKGPLALDLEASAGKLLDAQEGFRSRGPAQAETAFRSQKIERALQERSCCLPTILS